MIDQIAKIQLRRGPLSDLSGAALDVGELGFTTDTGQLFVGLTTSGYAEVLSQNTPTSISQPIFRDNNFGFYVSLPLLITGSATTLQVNDLTMTPQNFYFDLPISGANAVIQYFVYDIMTHYAIRHGSMHLIWNASMGSAVFTDTPTVGTGSSGDLVWTALVSGSPPNQHVMLQYTWNGGPDDGRAFVFFRIDRPYCDIDLLVLTGVSGITGFGTMTIS
jgi:hypothetical protein